LTDIEREVEFQEAALDAYTATCHRALIAKGSELVNGRPEGLAFEDGATAVLGALVGTLVHAAGAAMPQFESEGHEAYAARIVAFLVEGLTDAAPVFLAAVDEDIPL
jgi:hypothetical protein